MLFEIHIVISRQINVNVFNLIQHLAVEGYIEFDKGLCFYV